MCDFIICIFVEYVLVGVLVMWVFLNYDVMCLVMCYGQVDFLFVFECKCFGILIDLVCGVW